MKSNDINIENQRKFGVRATQVSHGEPGKVYLGQVAELLQHFLLLILLRRLGPVHKSYLWFLNGFEWLRVYCPFIWNAHFVCFHAIEAGPLSLISSGLGREQAPWCSVTDISVPWARISKGSHTFLLFSFCALSENDFGKEAVVRAGYPRPHWLWPWGKRKHGGTVGGNLWNRNTNVLLLGPVETQICI